MLNIGKSLGNVSGLVDGLKSGDLGKVLENGIPLAAEAFAPGVGGAAANMGMSMFKDGFDANALAGGLGGQGLPNLLGG